MTTMGEVLPYRPLKAREETTAWLGMVLFLASWAMLFASIFFAYGFVRAHSAQWPPEDLPRLPRLWPLVNSVVIAASSAVLQYGLVQVRRGKPRLLGPALAATVLLGAGFLVLQVLLWQSLYQQGLHADTGGPYASVFYGLTWLHALHVAVGLVGLSLLCRRAFRGEFSPARHLPVRLWAMYWHFVGIVWALMFVSVFLI